MARAKKQRRGRPMGSSGTIPPGARREALDRPLDPGGGPPGSGAGPRHAAGDPGSNIESVGAAEETFAEGEPPAEELDSLEQGPPYAGISGGAVGGSPAELRASGGRVHHGLAPGGSHRGDSTIGADPGADIKKHGRNRSTTRRRH